MEYALSLFRTGFIGYILSDVVTHFICCSLITEAIQDRCFLKNQRFVFKTFYWSLTCDRCLSRQEVFKKKFVLVLWLFIGQSIVTEVFQDRCSPKRGLSKSCGTLLFNYDRSYKTAALARVVTHFLFFYLVSCDKGL